MVFYVVVTASINSRMTIESRYYLMFDSKMIPLVNKQNKQYLKYVKTSDTEINNKSNVAMPPLYHSSSLSIWIFTARSFFLGDWTVMKSDLGKLIDNL